VLVLFLGLTAEDSTRILVISNPSLLRKRIPDTVLQRFENRSNTETFRYKKKTRVIWGDLQVFNLVNVDVFELLLHLLDAHLHGVHRRLRVLQHDVNQSFTEWKEKNLDHFENLCYRFPNSVADPDSGWIILLLMKLNPDTIRSKEKGNFY
jgi:hypothetical protein